MGMPARCFFRPDKLTALFLITAGSFGCASPGTPRPPSLHLPQPVSDLTAERVGADVHLHWTTPPKTTDGLNLKGSVVAEVCRVATSTVCTPIRRLSVVAGPSNATDSLPREYLTGASALLTYKVDLRNKNEHSAGLSTAAFVVSGSAPPPITELTAIPTAQGAVLRWKPEDAADQIELERHRVQQARSSEPKSVLGDSSEKDPPDTRLRAGKPATGPSPFQADAGGTIDRTARKGETYTYTAQRVRTIVVAGHSLEVRSQLSPPVTFIFRDVFPPARPAGLEAIGNASLTPPSIDLSWQPNADADLAGYRVYRQEGAAASVLLTRDILQVPGFRDSTALVGHRYSYTITAIDNTGNESPPGESVVEELNQP